MLGARVHAHRFLQTLLLRPGMLEATLCQFTLVPSALISPKDKDLSKKSKEWKIALLTVYCNTRYEGLVFFLGPPSRLSRSGSHCEAL